MAFTCPVSEGVSEWVTVAVASRVLQVSEESVRRWAQKGFLSQRQFYDFVSRRDVVDLAAKLIYSRKGELHADGPTDEEVKMLTKD